MSSVRMRSKPARDTKKGARRRLSTGLFNVTGRHRPGLISALTLDGRQARIAHGLTQLLLDHQQTVVLGDAVGTAQ